MTQLNTMRDEDWLKHIEAWESSALTQPAYCKEHGLSYSKFKKQRGKLSNRSRPTEKAAIGFRAISIPGISKKELESEAEVELGRGIKLTIRSYK